MQIGDYLCPTIDTHQWNQSGLSMTAGQSMIERKISCQNYATCNRNIQPGDRFECRRWLEDIQLPVPIMKWLYSIGNSLGNLTFVWRIPEDPNTRSQSEDIRILGDLQKLVPTFSTRAMRREFIERYNRVDHLKPAIIRDMWRTLTKGSL